MDGLILKTETLEKKNAFLIRAAGSIDTDTSSQLEEIIEKAIKDGQTNIVIDLAGVDFIASCGYGLLLSTTSELRGERGGELTLLSVSKPVQDMIETMGVDDFLRIVESVDDVNPIGEPA